MLNKNEHIQEKTNKIQKDFIYALTCEKDGSTKNIRLLDKSNVHNNVLQVINQYESINEEKDGRKTRYDVTF
ncbi:Type I restriction enzyme R protein N terminus (HSDR_N) [Chlamydia abortus]|nr:Type I restriction enzyme R protein N terminus (HSDR_N) [Chlamydia abortus]